MKIMELEPVFVEGFMPEKLEQGKLYISEEYWPVLHLCCCGCGKVTSTPIGIEGWKLTVTDKKVTLSPSVGNFQYPCKSHYFIRDNKVVWC
jgi:hypothetical protein